PVPMMANASGCLVVAIAHHLLKSPAERGIADKGPVGPLTLPVHHRAIVEYLTYHITGVKRYLEVPAANEACFCSGARLYNNRRHE
ncbi:MAG: hypothetical protein WBJ50_09205, partial [Smithellaceae bacterium]